MDLRGRACLLVAEAQMQREVLSPRAVVSERSTHNDSARSPHRRHPVLDACSRANMLIAAGSVCSRFKRFILLMVIVSFAISAVYVKVSGNNSIASVSPHASLFFFLRSARPPATPPFPSYALFC